MANHINLVAFGTFGSPNGFKQTFFVGSKELAKSVKTFDINTNAIKLFVNTKIYAIRKEYANGYDTIAYSLYTYAREQNSDRSGTFIGSSILYTNKIAQEHITISQLNEFHNELVNKNVVSDVLTVNHSDKLLVKKPIDFDKIEFNLREIDNINFRQNSENILVVFCNINDNQLKQFFEKSLDLLNIYDTIYFTDSQEVAEFVHQKGIFKLIQNVGEKKDFEREISNLIQERKRKRDKSISEFETEVEGINEEKNKAIQEFRTQIELSEKIHLENDRNLIQSKEDINKIGQFYDDFLNKTKSLINQIKHSNVKVEEVKQIHNSNKILFNKGFRELKKPIYTTTIAKPKPKGNLNIEHSRQDFDNKGSHRAITIDKADDKDNRLNLYKVATLGLSILLISTWVYLLFFRSGSEIQKNELNEQMNITPQEQIQIPVESTKLEDLKPKSNVELNQNDYRIIAKNITHNSTIGDVVKVIFDKNPTDIKSNYTGQEEIYSKHLIDLNKLSFEEKNGVYYFVKDTLRHIPSYEK